MTIMSARDHETKRALFKSHVEHLEKQIKDRDVLLHELEGSHTASDVYRARVSKELQEVKQEYELRTNKERMESEVSTRTYKSRAKRGCGADGAAVCRPDRLESSH